MVIAGPERSQDQTIEGMFAMDDELYSSYQSLKRTFGGNEVVLVVYHDDELLQESGRKRQQSLTAKIDTVEGISGKSISLHSLIAMIKSFNVDQFKLILQFAGFDISTQKLEQQVKSLFQGFTHSSDGKTAAIVVLLKAKEDTQISRGKIVASIREAVEKTKEELEFSNDVMLVGEPVMVADGFRMVQAGRKNTFVKR